MVRMDSTTPTVHRRFCNNVNNTNEDFFCEKETSPFRSFKASLGFSVISWRKGILHSCTKMVLGTVNRTNLSRKSCFFCHKWSCF